MTAFALRLGRMGERMARLRWSAWAVFALLVMLPWVFWARSANTRYQHFLNNQEFVGYRFFNALSIQSGEPGDVYLVQGWTSGLIQHVIVFSLVRVFGRPAVSPDTWSAYSIAYLGLAHLASALALLLIWLSRRLQPVDKWVTSLAALVPFYLITPRHLYDTDYFCYEVPFHLISLYLYLACDTGRVRSYLLCGAWAALGFLLKPTLLATGALPAIAFLMRDIRRASWLIPLGFLGGLVAVPTLYFLGNVSAAFESIRDLASFQPYALGFSGLGDLMWGSRQDPHLAGERTLVLGAILALAAGLTALALRPASRSRPAIVLMAHLVVVAVVFAYTLHRRPSSTTLFDATLSILYILPLVATVVPLKGTIAITAALTVLFAAVGRPAKFVEWTSTPGDWTSTMTVQAMTEAHDYARSLGTKTLAFVPYDRGVCHTYEKVVLWYGCLGRKHYRSQGRGALGPRDPREIFQPADDRRLAVRLLGDTHMVGSWPGNAHTLKTGIERGGVVIWTSVSQDATPPARYYPALAVLEDHPAAVIRRFRLYGSAEEQYIFVGYLPARPLSPKDGSTDPDAPRVGWLEAALGVKIEPAPNEQRQYLIRAPQGTVDFSRVGTVHTDLGYAVGVTLKNGVQIGFRFDPK